ncbi:uncharacterized protein A1O5_05168 [Cladophialophora psammophila CBS 110553]|uniref:Uncharacterized protein n=1 Tax=Cladophialophora psammophila CBS 110553 TaxID=1182543 RepID=W9X378_9EURO|nr:uncharacterized protein A1O5_05168 [Cladophialophora psammophila CBS 110553]EXJ71361.1 hypothetical protein A1O5_05168 [Cladophialophora psammophila CBS 110553]
MAQAGLDSSRTASPYACHLPGPDVAAKSGLNGVSAKILATITCTLRNILEGGYLGCTSVAQKMSWAS